LKADKEELMKSLDSTDLQLEWTDADELKADYHLPKKEENTDLQLEWTDADQLKADKEELIKSVESNDLELENEDLQLENVDGHEFSDKNEDKNLDDATKLMTGESLEASVTKMAAHCPDGVKRWSEAGNSWLTFKKAHTVTTKWSDN